MGLQIQDGSGSGSLATVDSTSKAQRVTLYDQSGNPMSDVGTLSNVLNALNAAATITLGGQSTVGFDVESTTGSLTLTFEYTINGTAWYAFNVTPVTGGVSVTTTTANGQWVGSVGGYTAVRARISTFTSGSMTVSAVVTPGGSTSAALTVSGTVTANQGTANTLANAWPHEITDGTHGPVAVKAASTAAAAADPSLVVGLSPNSPLPAGANAVGSVTVSNTVAVSAASLPLPTGAATSANQTTLGSQTTEINDGTHSGTIKAASTAAVATDTALVVAVSPNNTVAVSAASLPLPTGAATASNQTTLGSQTTEINDGTHSGTIKAASTAAVATDTALVVAVSPNNTVAVSAASLPLPTGAATASNQTTLGSQTTEINDGTHSGTIKAASTAAVATDTALVVAVSPNNTVAVTQSGTWSDTVTQATAANLNALVAQGAPNTAANKWPVSLTDGTNTAAVKAASTQSAATDPALVVALSPASAQTRASTAATTGVASSASSVTILAANSARLGAIITNSSTSILYLRYSSSAAAISSGNYTVSVAITLGVHEVPFGYTGQITGIWASANGFANVTEITV